jgi:predicted adenine nucleotide alpha hydrolase (AANH) superfamily ATPase
MLEMEKILLHLCCAPCSPYVIEVLEKTFDVTLFFYGPNIQPKEEYEFRLNEVKEFAEKIGAKLITGEYDIDEWNHFCEEKKEEPEGGSRCELCFEMRLKKTAALCKEQRSDLFTTSLTVSPHKNSKVINEIGEKIAAQTNEKFLGADFKKDNGFQKSVALAKKFGLKRQNYCGCLFSKRK